jgi:hypothetical protein
MAAKKVHIFRDEDCEMMRIESDGKCLFEGNYWDFDGERDVADLLRDLGLSVTEEGYEYE